MSLHSIVFRAVLKGFPYLHEKKGWLCGVRFPARLFFILFLVATGPFCPCCTQVQYLCWSIMDHTMAQPSAQATISTPEVTWWEQRNARTMFAQSTMEMAGRWISLIKGQMQLSSKCPVIKYHVILTELFLLWFFYYFRHNSDWWQSHKNVFWSVHLSE